MDAKSRRGAVREKRQMELRARRNSACFAPGNNSQASRVRFSFGTTVPSSTTRNVNTVNNVNVPLRRRVRFDAYLNDVAHYYYECRFAPSFQRSRGRCCPCDASTNITRHRIQRRAFHRPGGILLIIRVAELLLLRASSAMPGLCRVSSRFETVKHGGHVFVALEG